MEAAGGHIPWRLLGPFAVHDVFVSRVEPVTVYDLALRKGNDSAGLDSLVETRAGEDPEVGFGLGTQNLRWRALCPLKFPTNRIQGDADEGLPPLSQHGARLVKGLAISKGTKLEADLAIIIQGISGHYRWGRSRAVHLRTVSAFTHLFARLQHYLAVSGILLDPSQRRLSKIPGLDLGEGNARALLNQPSSPVSPYLVTC